MLHGLHIVIKLGESGSDFPQVNLFRDALPVEPTGLWPWAAGFFRGGKVSREGQLFQQTNYRLIRISSPPELTNR